MLEEEKEKIANFLMVVYDDENNSKEQAILSFFIGIFVGGHLLTSLMVFYESVWLLPLK